MNLEEFRRDLEKSDLVYKCFSLIFYKGNVTHEKAHAYRTESVMEFELPDAKLKLVNEDDGGGNVTPLRKLTVTLDDEIVLKVYSRKRPDTLVIEQPKPSYFYDIPNLNGGVIGSLSNFLSLKNQLKMKKFYVNTYQPGEWEDLIHGLYEDGLKTNLIEP